MIVLEFDIEPGAPEAVFEVLTEAFYSLGDPIERQVDGEEGSSVFSVSMHPPTLWVRLLVDDNTLLAVLQEIRGLASDLSASGQFVEYTAPNPVASYPTPPISTYISTIEAIDPTKPRPAKIKRVWLGHDYLYDCLVSESIKDQYLAGDVGVGDYVVVHFDDVGEQVVVAKVFESW